MIAVIIVLIVLVIVLILKPQFAKNAQVVIVNQIGLLRNNLWPSIQYIFQLIFSWTTGIIGVLIGTIFTLWTTFVVPPKSISFHKQERFIQEIEWTGKDYLEYEVYVYKNLGKGKDTLIQKRSVDTDFFSVKWLVPSDHYRIEVQSLCCWGQFNLPSSDNSVLTWKGKDLVSYEEIISELKSLGKELRQNPIDSSIEPVLIFYMQLLKNYFTVHNLNSGQYELTSLIIEFQHVFNYTMYEQKNYSFRSNTAKQLQQFIDHNSF